MAAFLSTQLDFIFFFYGLAFILLGAVCFAIRRSNPRGMPWSMLGLFGFLHGGLEWLDLLALIFGDSPAFAWARTALMMVSFIFLMEFARQKAVRLGMRMPGQWIYLLPILIVLTGGLTLGLEEANALARYSMGFVGAGGTAFIFALHGRALSGSERALALSAAFGFVLYGIAAGLIVPTAPLWPASVYNHAWFAALTGCPIQLVRGILACWVALAVWGIWGQKLIQEVSTTHHKQQLQRLLAMTVAAMATILLCGWVLTEYLGDIYKQNIEHEARGDVELISSHLTAETATVKGMVKALAGAPSVQAMLSEGTERTRALTVLSLDVEASDAERGFILDKNGQVAAATARIGSDTSEEQSSNPASYFRRALTGHPSQHFAYDRVSGQTVFYASAPVRDSAGNLIGAAVLKKSLERFARGLRDFNTPLALVDPYGIVALTNRPELQSRPLWVLPTEIYAVLSAQFGPLKTPPVLKQPVADAAWAIVDGARTYVQREYAGESAWSVVTLTSARGIFASRVLGIVITLMATATVLVYLAGRERWIQDTVQMDRRLELEELARDLRFQATTDPLTGLNNRLKFDRQLINEMLRAERYGTPLSMVIYDLDQFKRVNDTYGHQVGDEVLIEVSRVVSEQIRKTDFLARWGGEEFAILVPQGDAEAAYRLAKSLRNAIEDHDFGQAGAVTCSFGIAEALPGETADSLLARADAALYRAKINGRNRVERANASSADRPGLEWVA